MNINYSIIIPHHNTPDLLQRLVDSIPQREDIEVIIVDDNSDADKKANIQRPDVTTIFIDKEHSKGAGKARNVGMDNAHGKWILFSDSDDFFTDKLGSMMDKYKDTDADVILFPIRVVDSDTLEEGDFRNSNFNRLVYDNNLTNKQKLLRTAALWSKFLNRSLIEKRHIRCEEIPWSNDQWFSALVAIKAQKIICDKENKLYCLTYRTNSLTRNLGLVPFRCRLEAEIRFQKLCKENGIKSTRPTYFRFLRWASQLGLKTYFETNKRLREEGIGSHDNTLKHAVPVTFVRFLLCTIFKYHIDIEP